MLKRRMVCRSRFLYAMLCIAFVSQALAAPVITGVSGPAAHGAIVTITGSGFGVKSPARPYYWATFEPGEGAGGDQNPTALGRKTAWDGMWNVELGSVNMPPIQNGNQAIRGDTANSLSTSGAGPGVMARTPITGKQYVFMKRYVEFDQSAICCWNGSLGRNTKIIRYWAVRGSANQHSFTYQGNYSDNNGGNPRLTFDGTGGTTYNGGFLMPEFVWFTHEYVTSDSSAPGAADAVVQIWEWGSNQAGLRANIKGVSRTSSKPELYDELFLTHQVVGTAPADPAWIWFKDIYIDDSWARVMIGNAPTWTGCTAREIQIPSAWTDGSITITVNRGAMTTLGDKYLYVVDANGNVNQNGFRLCSACPNPPTNLLVQ